ncbi:MAG: hypothetical protein AAF682_16490 [Planctomycetota bacterium]
MSSQLGERTALARGAALDGVVLAALWCLAAVVVGPPPDFPLNDAWSYGVAVQRLVEEGRYAPTGWTATTLVTHVLWGALFCLPGGFSFAALKVASLAAGLIGAWGTYALVRGVAGRRELALLSAAVVAFNPVYFALANTFMTDVSYAAASTASAACLARGLRGGGRRWSAAGLALAVVALLGRHIGLVPLAAYGLALWVRRGAPARRLAAAATASGLGVAGLAGLAVWLGSAPRMLAQAFATPLYLGLFLLPVLAAVRVARAPRLADAGALVFALAGGAGIVAAGWRMPFLATVSEGNVIVAAGIGPLTLRDAFFLDSAGWAPLGPVFWAAATALALLGGALLVRTALTLSGELYARARSGPWDGADSAALFLLVASAFYCLPTAFLPGAFDRYLLPVLPLACGALAARAEGPTLRAPRLAAALAPAVCLLLFAVAGTRDYLAWNRARWDELHELVGERGVALSRIDGGFEFNGLHLYSRDYERAPERSWWWVEDDEYVLAFAPIDGYAVERRVAVRRWLPPCEDELLVLRRRD